LNYLDVIAARAAQWPDRLAFIDGGKTLTYRQLIGRVGAAARRLATIGVRPKDIVGLRLRDHAEHYAAILALGQLGAASVSLDWQAPPGETARLVRRLGVGVVIVEPGARSIEGSNAFTLDEIFRDSDTLVFGDRFCDAGDLPLKISLSSGTTGEPHGVAVTHRQYVQRWLTAMDILGPSTGHNVLVTAPVFFIGGRNIPFFGLCSGHTVVRYPTLYSPEELIDVIHRYEIKSTLIVPTMIRALLKLAPETGYLLPSLEPVSISAAPLFAPEKHAVVRHLTPHFYENYSTSGAGNLTRLLTRDLEHKADSVGKPAVTNRVRVVDDAGGTLPAGETGLICAQGPSIPSDPEAALFGYSQADAAAIIRDGWFYPGEIGAFDEDGYLYIKGRATDVIIRGGSNVYPEEVEKVLLTAAGITDAAVFGQPSDVYGETVMAIVVGGDDLDLAAVKRHCRRQLSAYKVPEVIKQWPDLPRTAAGKIRKTDLAGRFLLSGHTTAC